MASPGFDARGHAGYAAPRVLGADGVGTETPKALSGRSSIQRFIDSYLLKGNFLPDVSSSPKVH